SILGNNTWVLADLTPGCKPLGCKWIFKSKLKLEGTIKKFKARLVIQGFKQKSRIDYFDTYVQVIRISTIRLLIVMASIHNLIIHQMDVKTAFLNGKLDEDVYMNQPQGFIMSENKNKVCKLIESLYGLKQATKQWHQKFDEVILSNGYLLNQADKCVDLTKEFLSSRFSMKDMGEADVIFVAKLSRYTSNPGTQYWQAIQRASKKQTCITGSTIKSKIMALAAAGVVSMSSFGIIPFSVEMGYVQGKDRNIEGTTCFFHHSRTTSGMDVMYGVVRYDRLVVTGMLFGYVHVDIVLGYVHEDVVILLAMSRFASRPTFPSGVLDIVAAEGDSTFVVTIQREYWTLLQQRVIPLLLSQYRASMVKIAVLFCFFDG
nr:zinc finger, CCHC-type [Tanacetum cinerariifolium]